jgi:hypothetical protein
MEPMYYVKGFQTGYRLSPAGRANCGKLVAKSARKVLRSSPWARHLIGLKRLRKVCLHP